MNGASDSSNNHIRQTIPDMSKILVIGHKGMLGTDLVERLGGEGFAVEGVDRDEIDITAPAQVFQCLEACRPRLVINCAAYTAVDRAETEAEAAFAVNRDGPGHIAAACERFDCPLVHISTDYVFDGCASTPYKENDPVNPMSVYGRSKWEGEAAVRSRLRSHLIVRTAWLFGAHGNSFVKTILRLSVEREELRIVSDQYGCPTWTGDLAAGLVQLSKRVLESARPVPWGTYHYCGKGATSWYEFARAIVRESAAGRGGRMPAVVPIATEDYPLPARRPAWSVLDCSKMATVFGIESVSWRNGLEVVIGALSA